jgi:hypothetical protein
VFHVLVVVVLLVLQVLLNCKLKHAPLLRVLALVRDDLEHVVAAVAQVGPYLAALQGFLRDA